MTRTWRPTYPGFWNSVLLCVAFVALQLVLTTPFGIVDAIWNSKLLRSPAVSAVVNLLACALVLGFASLTGRLHFREICGRGRVGPGAVLAVVVSTTGAAILLNQVDNLVFAVMPPPKWVVRQLRELFSPERPLASFCLLVIVAPITEELLFRGVILRGLLQRFRPGTAILLSSILFMAVHVIPWQYPTALGLGLLLGFWYARTRSLVPCLVGHAVANGLAFATVMVLLKVRGHTLGEFGKPEAVSPWLVGAGLALATSGSWFFLRAAPAAEPSLGAVSELDDAVPAGSGTLPPIPAAPSGEAALVPSEPVDPGPALGQDTPSRRTRTAIASFVLGLFSVLCLGFLAGLPAIVLGYKARRQIEQAPARFKGSGLALAGMTLGWLSVIPTLFVAWVIATMLFPGSNNLFLASVQSEGCINNLDHIGVALRTWAQNHDGQFPMSTVRMDPGASADHDQRMLAFRQLDGVLSYPRRLICPADASRHRATDFQSLQATNISYRFETGPEINPRNPVNVLARCPIHGHELLCDGTVRRAFDRPLGRMR